MAAIAVVVFVALYFVNAGYGKFYNKHWGPTLDNHLGWFLMEAPVFVAMLVLWWLSDRRSDYVRLVFLLLFEAHYFHRSFIFPLQLRGHSRMPWAIVGMGALFNTLNAFMQGGWIFYISPADMYPASWLRSLPFIAGVVVFAAGMFINIQSDTIIRNLRQPGDTAHYLPKGGMFRYVAGANYLGEFMEWAGFACSPGRGPEPYSPSGLSPTSPPGLPAPTISTPASSPKSSTRKKSNASYPSSIKWNPPSSLL